MTDPVPDTADLRLGVPLHDALLALLPLVGRWRGEGVGIGPGTGEEFRFGQQITIVHDGRPFLAYESRSWLVADDGSTVRQAWRENGFWRPGAGADDIELVLAANTGVTLVLAGTAGDRQGELATIATDYTPTAKAVTGERRLYGLSGDDLVYATELAPAGAQYAPHLNARLVRSSAGVGPGRA